MSKFNNVLTFQRSLQWCIDIWCSESVYITLMNPKNPVPRYVQYTYRHAQLSPNCTSLDQLASTTQCCSVIVAQFTYMHSPLIHYISIEMHTHMQSEDVILRQNIRPLNNVIGLSYCSSIQAYPNLQQGRICMQTRSHFSRCGARYMRPCSLRAWLPSAAACKTEKHLFCMQLMNVGD